MSKNLHLPSWNQKVSGIGRPTTFKSNLAVCPSKHLKEVGFNTKTGLYSLSSCDSSVSSSLRPGDIRAGDIRRGDIRAGDMRIGDLLTERGEMDLKKKGKAEYFHEA